MQRRRRQKVGGGWRGEGRGAGPWAGREEAASAAGLGHDSVASSSPGVVRRLHLCGALNARTFPLHLSSVNSEAKRRKLQLREQTLATGGERVLAGRVVGLRDVSRLAGERPLVQAPGRRREGPRGETRPSGGSSSDQVGGGARRPFEPVTPTLQDKASVPVDKTLLPEHPLCRGTAALRQGLAGSALPEPEPKSASCGASAVGLSQVPLNAFAPCSQAAPQNCGQHRVLLPRGNLPTSF